MATRVRDRASGRSASRSPQVMRRISYSRSMRPRVHQTRALRPGRGRKNGVPLLIALLRLAAHPCRTTGTVGVLPALGIPTIHVSAAGGGIPPPESLGMVDDGFPRHPVHSVIAARPQLWPPLVRCVRCSLSFLQLKAVRVANLQCRNPLHVGWEPTW